MAWTPTAASRMRMAGRLLGGLLRVDVRRLPPSAGGPIPPAGKRRERGFWHLGALPRGISHPPTANACRGAQWLGKPISRRPGGSGAKAASGGLSAAWPPFGQPKNRRTVTSKRHCAKKRSPALEAGHIHRGFTWGLLRCFSSGPQLRFSSRGSPQTPRPARSLVNGPTLPPRGADLVSAGSQL